eukprot:TRINITY_DN6445_c0_g1_i2.p1 TRINITY_DN6445_c0_g1~~TRINITY_DN6445_c0_g1_i2.p1  ORF type:complete len:265 (-),score=70.69 TRINITY_DN6445_c0_g1_i2:73-867(-)
MKTRDLANWQQSWWVVGKKLLKKEKKRRDMTEKAKKEHRKKRKSRQHPKKEHEEGGSPRVPSSPSSSFPPPSPLSSSLGSSSSLSSSYFGEFRSKLKDPVRAKVQQFFFEALTFKIENATNYEPGLPLELSEKIERELYDLYGGPTKDYKGQSRKLFLNLKNESNPSFKENVLTGVIDVSKLCRMSPEEMGSEEMIKKRKEHEEAALKNVIVDDSAGQATTDMFRCGKCGERKTTYYQMQTRSADEPMTTFITCTNCKNRWKQN